MDLIIDVGNTLAKLAVYNFEGQLLYKQAVPLEALGKQLDSIEDLFPAIEWCILSSVGGLDTRDRDRLEKLYTVLYLNTELAVPFRNLYASPTTLGVDRIALVSAACHQYPNSPVLVIDMGTCITYDSIDASGAYYGGAISPGLQMRYKAMHKFTDKLPLLEASEQVALIGENTKQSMHSGVIHGITYEIEGFIAAYLKEFPGLTVVLTGGDAEFLHKNIKNDIFVHTNFLLEGLLYILKYNKDIS